MVVCLVVCFGCLVVWLVVCACCMSFFCILRITFSYELAVRVFYMRCVFVCLRMVCVSFLCSFQYLFYELAVCFLHLLRAVAYHLLNIFNAFL